MSKLVVVCGANGKLGRMVAEEVLSIGGKVRCFVRPGREQAVQDLKGRGAEVLAGEASNKEDAMKAVQGAFSVVSALQGGREIIVDAQLTLLEACKDAGVRRFFPSDFSVDMFGLDMGDNVNLDLRKEHAAKAAQLKGNVQVIHPLNGCFLDKDVLFGFLGAFDLQAGTLSYWGDGKQPMDFTTFRDTARIVGRAAVDDRDLPMALCIKGEELDVHGLAQAYEKGSGRKIELKQLGSLEDLDRDIAKNQAETPSNILSYVPNMYWRAMLTGKGKMKNDHGATLYPDVQFTTVASYVKGMQTNNS